MQCVAAQGHVRVRRKHALKRSRAENLDHRNLRAIKDRVQRTPGHLGTAIRALTPIDRDGSIERFDDCQYGYLARGHR